MTSVHERTCSRNETVARVVCEVEVLEGGVQRRGRIDANEGAANGSIEDVEAAVRPADENPAPSADARSDNGEAAQIERDVVRLDVDTVLCPRRGQCRAEVI